VSRLARARGRVVAVAAVFGLTGTAACGLLIGLEDHELYPAEGGTVSESGADSTTGGDTGSHTDGGSEASDAQLDAHEAGPVCEASLCGDACVDLQNDNTNCGVCGTVCDAAACYHATCGGSAVTAISAGAAHACALLLSGDVLCWGADDKAQILGPGDAGSCAQGPCRVSPTFIAGLPRAVQISAGGDQTCAVDADGGVWCWGSNQGAGLGHSPTSDPTCPTADASVPCNAQPTAVTLPGPATSVASGQTSFACALVGQNVYCWGDDTTAELGPSGNGTPSAAPQFVLAGASSVTAGFAHACALVDGGPACWGSNASGELGHAPGDVGDQSCPGASFCNATPQLIPVTGAFRLHSGRYASCFETTTGISCLGANNVGQLGLGSSDGSADPVPAPVSIEPGNLTGEATMDLGYETVCVIAGGRIYCWGDNETNQTTEVNSGFCGGVPCIVGGVSFPLGSPTEVHTAPYATYLRTIDGKVWAWGDNGFGQLGSPLDAGAEGGCDPAGFPPSGTFCNATPVPVQGLP